ncbi:hypothetical protein VTO42DRAFT_5844 [Malbranchea cinnamomea]
MSCEVPRPIEPSLDLDDGSSDYGPDFTAEEQEILNALLEKATGPESNDLVSATAAVIDPVSSLPTVQQGGALEVLDIEDQEHVLAEVFVGQRKSASAGSSGDKKELGCRVGEHPNSPEGRELERRKEEERYRTGADASEQSALNDDGRVDRRSPLERFRRPPRKGLSVTDLVSPAWCELQYWYTLTKFGKKKATPAMRQGSVVHKALEEQVHTTVSVEVMTKEDGWALRIWNVIQGLHTLRKTGMTRELEIWGVIDGEVVTGIIDMLSYECPDPELDAKAETYYAAAKTSESIYSEPGTTLADYLLSPAGGGRTLFDFAVTNSGSKDSSSYSSIPPVGSRIYLSDIKTRGSSSRSIPSLSSIGFRPTRLQLHLYYHLLTRLITTDELKIETIAARYGLQTDKPLSDTFIAQVASLNEEGFSDVLDSEGFDSNNASSNSGDQHPDQSSQNDTLTMLLQHNSLSSLWTLMKQHLRTTFLPHPSSSSQTPMYTFLSPLLTATYVSSPIPDPESPGSDFSPQSPQSITYLGSRSFFFDPSTLYPFLADGMRFWRGIRPAHGVPLHEAWKCRICEFRDECEWRKQKEIELGQARSKRAEQPDAGQEQNEAQQFDASNDKSQKE